MEQLKVTIKPKFEPAEGQTLKGSGYSININGWELGRGVTHFKLDMPAGQKPKATITFEPQLVDIEGVVADIATRPLELIPEGEV